MGGGGGLKSAEKVSRIILMAPYIGKRNKGSQMGHIKKKFKTQNNFKITGLVSENFSRGPINDVSFTAKPNELQICGKSFEMKQFLNRCLVAVVYLENERIK